MHYKLYPAKKKNAKKSSELHFYNHFIARSVKENNNNNKRTKNILSTVLFFEKEKLAHFVCLCVLAL